MKLFSQNDFGKYADIGLLILRVGLGAMFIYHGAPKLFGGPEKWTKIGEAIGNFGITAFPAFWGFMAGVAEFGGGLCVITGFLFTPGCILLIINLIVASSSHLSKGQGLGGAAHAIEDGIVFFSLLFIGSGKYTLMHLFSRQRDISANIT